MTYGEVHPLSTRFVMKEAVQLTRSFRLDEANSNSYLARTNT